MLRSNPRADQKGINPHFLPKVRGFFYHIAQVREMYYKIKYEIDHINRDLHLEDLLELVNQHLLKKYCLASATKRIRDQYYLVSIDNNSEAKLVLYNQFYARLED